MAKIDNKLTQFKDNNNWQRIIEEDIKQLIDIAVDLKSWDEALLEIYCPKKMERNCKIKNLNTNF